MKEVLTWFLCCTTIFYHIKSITCTTKGVGPPTAVLPPDYDANSYCEFHFGTPEYSIENCKALKDKVQDLINLKAITFAPNDPNVINNHMPPRNKANVNM